MTDDLTPPPSEPLDPATRARMRHRVLAGVDTHRPGRAAGGRRLLVPLAAAAAVVVVAGVGGVAAVRSDDAPDESPAAPGSATPPPTGPATTPPPSGAPAVGQIPTGGGADACRPELVGPLRDAEAVLTVPGTYGSTTYFVQGGRYQLCSTSGDAVTLHAPQPLDAGAPDDLDDPTRWQVSTDVVASDRTASVTTFLAGGQVTSDALSWEVVYRFPDGHVERSTTSTDDEGRRWWRMEYTVDDGVLADPRQNQTRLDEIRYDVRVGGTSNPGTLAWGLDTCAQVNHGC